MTGENEDAAQQDWTTDDPTQTQPQPDPIAAPEGTTGPDDQDGTTGDVGTGKEPLYQTRYQKLVEQMKARGLDPDEFLQSGKPAGSIRNAFTGQYQPQPQPPASVKPDDQVTDFDPYDPVQMKAYLDQNFGKIRGNLTQVVANVIQEVEQSKKMEAQMEVQFGEFDTWATDNQVPQEIINQAVQQYQADFGTAGTPKAFVRTVKAYVKDMGFAAGQAKNQNKAVQDAIEKARALDGVTLPAQGASPSPAAKPGITPAQQQANEIAPEDNYHYHGPG